MKEKQRQPQPDGAIISNLRYAYGMLFREYPITRLLLPLTVLVSVLFPLTGNLLPAMIVAMLEKQNLAGFAAAVAAVGMVMLLLKWGTECAQPEPCLLYNGVPKPDPDDAVL